MDNMDDKSMLIPVILSGGAGTRLWPVSRKAHPKPFMRLASGQTLAESTVDRALKVAGSPVTLTVTGRDYYFLTRDLVSAGRPGWRSPFSARARRSQHRTGDSRCGALGCRSIGPEACLLVLPADHLMREMAPFEQAVEEASSGGWTAG
jgi:mannose-1-phosphate guanylyltransferase / mannose-6-phosphate isomerase